MERAELPAPPPAMPPLSVRLLECPAPGHARAVSLRLPPGSTLGDALTAAGVDWPAARVGIWGRVRPLATLLREGDRIELYRELRADPKHARRERAQRAGLSGSRTR